MVMFTSSHLLVVMKCQILKRKLLMKLTDGHLLLISKAYNNFTIYN